MSPVATEDILQKEQNDATPLKPKRKVEVADLVSSRGFSAFIQQFYDSAPLHARPEEFAEFLLGLSFEFTHSLYQSLSTSHVLSRIRVIPGKEKMLAEIRRVVRKIYAFADSNDADAANDGFADAVAQFSDTNSALGDDSSWIHDDPPRENARELSDDDI